MGNDLSCTRPPASAVEQAPKPLESQTVITNASASASASDGLFFPFLVTSIDVIVTGQVEGDEYGNGAQYIEFDGKIEADPEDDDVAFLMKVKAKQINEDGSITHQGIMVSQDFFVQELKKENKKVLACIHGFQTEPENWMDFCTKISENEAFNHLVIPVIWPSVGKVKSLIALLSKYDEEQAIALQAGTAFNSIADIGLEINLSVMCHSMGNRVLFSFVSSTEDNVVDRFDDIFMVAADVWEEVFNERVIEESWWQNPFMYKNEWKGTGLKVCRMVKKKIHIFSCAGDLALSGSWFENYQRTRIGQYGKAGQADRGRLHKECADKLVGIDYSDDIDAIQEVDPEYFHTYMAMPKIVEYYASVMDE